MNLTTDGWIPVANAAGEKKLLSLRQVFAEGQHWQDFAVRPHERVALMRLLICIAQAALKGPMTMLDGCMDELPAKIEAYLVEWHDTFELFHPTKPFLQFAGLAKAPKAAKKAAGKKAAVPAEDEDDEDATAASKMDFALATGNNTTLFDHDAASSEAREFTPAQLALMLITFQCFSPSGIIGAAKWREHDISKVTAPHSPCTPSAMLHAFIRRGSLLTTIVGNLLTFETVNSLYRRDSWGLPVWEWLPESFADNEAIQNATQTYLGRLMPLSRAILLRPDGAGLLLANGLDYPTPPDFPPEPSASQVKKRDETGLVLVGAGSRALWRELPALVVRRKLGEPGGPLTVSEVNNDQSFDLWIGALITDKASILDTVEGVYSIPAKMLRDEGRKTYENEIHECERVAAKLGDACKKYREHLETRSQKDIGTPYDTIIRVRNKEKGYPEAKAAVRHYWNTVEQLLWMLNACIAAEDGSEDQTAKRIAWRSALWKAARDAYYAACAFETPRQKRAFPLGLRSLQYIQRKKDEPTTPTTKAA